MHDEPTVKSETRRRPLSREQARRVYDRIGRAQDWQRFYEDPATSQLVVSSAFGSARLVVELGCGTGRFAARLLERELPPEARYRGIDISPTMVDLARQRLSPWYDRATVELADPARPLRLPVDDGSADRVVANYVFDLLGDDDTMAALLEAYRALEPAGLLCAAGLTRGEGGVAGAVSRAWEWVWQRNPALVGGCRPIALVDGLDSARWRVQHRSVVVAWGIPSETAVAEKIDLRVP